MRLTLRTLLAYLDDTLDPAEIKRIGQKVAESDTARELIARIKSVTRRRRLTTPALTGTADKFDPNTIAEYLDNTLPAEQVEEIEKICLESDVHLAEIAACHQILTLVLGEPALVPPSAKRRMYALAGGRGSGVRSRAPRPAAAAAGHRPEDGGEDDALLLGLPALSRGQGTWLRWLLPIAGCLILAGLVFAIIKVLPQGNEQAQRRQRPGSSGTPVASADSGKPKNETGKTDQPDKNGKADTQPAKDGKNETPPPKDTKPPPKPGDTQPPPVEPVHVAGSTKAPAWSAAPPSPKVQPVGKLVRNDAWQDLVAQSPGSSAPWRRLVANGRFSTGDTLVSLPGYHGELGLDNGVHVILWGNVPQQLGEKPILESAITPHATEPDKEGGMADLDFTLSRGRVWIINKKREDQPAYVRLRFHKEIWDLTLQPGTEIGIDLLGFEFGLKPTRAEEGPDALLELVVRKGRLTFRDDLREFPPMAEKSIFIWTNRAGSWPGPQPLERWPEVWEQPVQIRQDVPGGREMERALRALRNRLTGEQDIGSPLAETVDTAEGPTGRALTVICFSALDYIEQLIPCLANEQYPDVRDAAVDALRHWLGRGPGQRDRFGKELEKNYTKAEVGTILQLLRRPDREDFLERDTYSFPVDELSSDKLAIRHLAFWQLMRLVPSRDIKDNKLFFDPAGPPELRDAMQKKWRKALDDGKLLPDQLHNPPGKQ